MRDNRLTVSLKPQTVGKRIREMESKSALSSMGKRLFVVCDL